MENKPEQRFLAETGISAQVGVAYDFLALGDTVERHLKKAHGLRRETSTW